MLIVRQKPQTGTWVLIIALIVSAGCAVYFRRAGQLRIARDSRTVLVFLVFFLLLTPLFKTYTLTIDGNAHTLSWSATRFGQEVSRTSFPASDLSSAEMESSRGDRRIVVILRNGSPVYPLGDMYFTGQDKQYVVLQAIRNLIAGRSMSGLN